MLVRQIRPVQVENRCFRGEVLDKVEVSTQVQRVLLQDCKGDCIYVIMQGSKWYQRGKSLRRGDKVQLGPFNPKPVPTEFASFFPKNVEGFVADIYIDFTPSDFDYGILVDSPETTNYTSLSYCIEAACEQVPGYFNIAGVLLDYLQEDRSTMSIIRCKLTDDSLEPGEFLQVTMFIKDLANCPKVSKTGDIIVLHAMKLSTYGGKPQATYDSKSSSFGVFSLATMERISGQVPLFKETEAKVSCLVDWGFVALQTMSVLTGRSLKNLGCLKNIQSDTLDCVCFVFKLLGCYPHEGWSSMVLCDSTGCAIFEAADCLFVDIKEGTWIKLRDVKASYCHLKASYHTALLPVPEFCKDVQGHLSSKLPGLSSMKEQASALAENMQYNSDKMQEKFVSHTTLQGVSLLTLAEVLDPHLQNEFCRFRCLLIDFQPRTLETWLAAPHVGLMSVWALSEVIEIVVTPRSANDLFSLASSTVEQAEARLKDLMSDSNWLELGLRRVVWNGRVLLELYKTFAV